MICLTLLKMDFCFYAGFLTDFPVLEEGLPDFLLQVLLFVKIK